ncbi:hypothetical protein [Vulcanococcus limneticus]|uniref:hypothetical protein n=1 Tax=Vulcanococcus limneticus TaxID=2170428 RepID=UPI00398C100C
MACPHCGDHMLTPAGQQLLCCGCGRPQPHLGPNPMLSWLRAHGLILLGVVMLLPLAVGMGRLDALQMAAKAGGDGPAAPERVAEHRP